MKKMTGINPGAMDIKKHPFWFYRKIDLSQNWKITQTFELNAGYNYRMRYIIAGYNDSLFAPDIHGVLQPVDSYPPLTFELYTIRTEINFDQDQSGAIGLSNTKLGSPFRLVCSTAGGEIHAYTMPSTMTAAGILGLNALKTFVKKCDHTFMAKDTMIIDITGQELHSAGEVRMYFPNTCWLLLVGDKEPVNQGRGYQNGR